MTASIGKVINRCFKSKRNLMSFRGTKDFIVSVSESRNGPWTNVKEGSFTDPRYTGEPYNPQELITFQIDPVTAKYVKFSCTSFYGLGCVLQYIGVSQGNY